ncbi:MAG: 2'-5' RNA ligase family protein [Paucibacter sp.]|nr:2'-5' RNA ligase family protein [Roseateles sp.]
MGSQPSLPGFETDMGPFPLDAVPPGHGTVHGYNLFLALFPDGPDALRIGDAAWPLIRQYGLDSSPLPLGRLHITLHALAYFPGQVSRVVVEAACAAVARIQYPTIPVVFDQAMSFPGNNAFVLLCTSNSNADIAGLRKLLQGALKRVELRPQPSSTPHMTLRYRAGRVVDRRTIEPIRWIAKRYALILSHQGVTYYQRVSEWLLTNRH